jgi:hypothetical protein
VLPTVTKYRVHLSIDSHSGPSYQIVGTALIHACGQTDRQADRQTDMTKLIGTFQIMRKLLINAQIWNLTYEKRNEQ